MTIKPPNPNAPTAPSDLPAPTAAGDTQVIDLQDVELLIAAQSEQLEHARSLPPPLPAEVRASHVPSEPVRRSEPPALSQAPSPAPGPQRSSAFYVVALLVFLVVGIGGGLLVAMKLRTPPPAAVVTTVAPTAKPQATVITIPVVEVADDVDGGPSGTK